MKILLYLIFAFLSLDICVFAQAEPIEPAFVDQAVEYVRDAAELMPVKKPTHEQIRKQLETKMFWDDGKEISFALGDNFGFGFKQFNYSKPGAYCDFYASGFVLNTDLAKVDIGITCRGYWKFIREPIIKAWKDAGGPAFQENEKGIFCETLNTDVVEKYKNEVSALLGPMKAVTIPASLEKPYNELVAPMKNSVVGDACGGNPKGKDSINLFIAAKRIDLLENILRGYNPGGRIYAALALLKMEKNGTKLDPKTRDTVEKVANLDSEMEVCVGLEHSNQKGKDILKLINL